MIPILYFFTGVVVGATGSFFSLFGCLTVINTINEDNDEEENNSLKVRDMITQTNTIINKESSIITIGEYYESNENDENDSDATTEHSVSDEGDIMENSFYSIFMPYRRKTKSQCKEVHFKN